METLLEKLLSRITWLNLGSEKLIAEFSAHIGWSLAYLFIAQRILGDAYLLHASLLWIAYSVYKELIEDEHLNRIVTNRETKEDLKDLLTDFLSRTVGVFVVLLIEYIRLRRTV